MATLENDKDKAGECGMCAHCGAPLRVIQLWADKPQPFVGRVRYDLTSYELGRAQKERGKREIIGDLRMGLMDMAMKMYVGMVTYEDLVKLQVQLFGLAEALERGTSEVVDIVAMAVRWAEEVED